MQLTEISEPTIEALLSVQPAVERESDPISVGLVEDHEVTRRGIRQVLGRNRQITVVGEAADARSAVLMLRDHQPDVVLLDIRLGESSGIDVLKAAKTVAPDSKIVVLTAYDDVRYVRAMVRLGAAGYLLKNASAQELKRAIRDAAAGKVVIDPALAGKVVELVARDNGVRSESARKSGRLTAREAEILEQVGKGRHNNEIADAMGITRKTVEAHVQHILQKMGVRSRTQAVLKALEAGQLWEAPV